MGGAVRYARSEGIVAYVRRSTLDDVRSLAPRLRSEDAAEVMANSGRSPLFALASGFFSSDVPLSIVGDDEEVVGMFGVVPEAPGAAAIWLLASDDLKRYQLPFLRQCRQYINAFHVKYPLLYNVVDERNTVHLKWLQWCGFTFINRHEAWGHESRPFLEFCKLKESE